MLCGGVRYPTHRGNKLSGFRLAALLWDMTPVWNEMAVTIQNKQPTCAGYVWSSFECMYAQYNAS